jgi:hypothetical protein
MEKAKTPPVKIKILSETGIFNVHSNGGRSKTVIFKLGSYQFKIDILSESFASQSYARLYKWTEQSGFSLVTNKNPMRDYKIDVSYRDNYLQTTFDPIVRDLKKLAKNFI